MELKLIRKIFSEKSTIGDLYTSNDKMNFSYQCRILEDKDRGLIFDMPIDELNKIKIFGLTAIPYGRYEVIISKSTRFSKLAGYDVFLPELLNVPGYLGVRIHSGNRPEDTEGCLLTGITYGVDVINESRKAFDELFPKLKESKDKIFITIEKQHNESV